MTAGALAVAIGGGTAIGVTVALPGGTGQSSGTSQSTAWSDGCCQTNSVESPASLAATKTVTGELTVSKTNGAMLPGVTECLATLVYGYQVRDCHRPDHLPLHGLQGSGGQGPSGHRRPWPRLIKAGKEACSVVRE